MSTIGAFNLVRALLDGQVPEGVGPEKLDEPWRSILLHLGPGASRGEVEALLGQLTGESKRGEEMAARRHAGLDGESPSSAAVTNGREHGIMRAPGQKGCHGDRHSDRD